MCPPTAEDESTAVHDGTASPHGAKRLAKRQGLPKRAIARAVEAAREHGTPREQTNGSLRRFLDSKYHGHDPHYIAVFNGNVFIFGSKAGPLITTFPLPGRLRHSKATRALTTGRSPMHGEGEPRAEVDK